MTSSPQLPLLEQDPTASLWRWPMLPLWVAFFIMGLLPVHVFLLLRHSGVVLTQSAMVNSPWLLYWGLVSFITWFVYARCREASLSPASARGRAFTAFCYGVVAFYPPDIEALLNWSNIPFMGYRILLGTSVSIKLIAWIYLLVMVLRYHFTAGAQAFAALPTLLPSVRQAENHQLLSPPPLPEKPAPDAQD